MKPQRVLFIDNVDSFSFNLVDEFRKRGAEVSVWRNDLPAGEAFGIAMAGGEPALIVLSPGPGAPADAGCCVGLVRIAAGRAPVFGVCLGHQAIVEAFGGVVGPAGAIVHGKASPVTHKGEGPFSGLDSPFMAARYHSLSARRVPECLRVTAVTGDTVMAVEHREAKVFGVQFHPESILTPAGGVLIENVLEWARGDGGGVA